MGGYLITLDEAKDHLDKNGIKHDDDDELLDMVEAVTPIVENYVGPVVVRQFVERVEGGCVLVLSRHPVTELISVVPWLNIGTTYNVVDLVIDPDTSIVERKNGWPFTGGPFRVTYKAGRDPVPPNLVLAAKEIVADNWDTQRGRTLRLPQSPNAGEPIVIKGRAYFVPRRAIELMNPQERGPLVG